MILDLRQLCPSPLARGRLGEGEEVAAEHLPLTPSKSPPYQEGDFSYGYLSRSPLQKIDQRGFTLLELLVALAVFAVIAVAAYSGLRSVLFTQTHVEQETERLAQVQMAVNFLSKDLEQVVARSIRDEYGREQPALGGDENDELISLTRAGWDNFLGRQRATLQRVAYRLEGEELIRSYWQTLDRSGLSEAQEASLLEGIQEVRLRFLDEQDTWQSEWPPRDATANTAPLPRAVEVSLMLSDWGEITRLFLLPGS